MVSGYILVNVKGGMALEAASEIVKVDGVKTACAITGSYDVIATFEVENISEIGSMVVEGIHQCIEGVSNTQTVVCVKCCCK